MHQLKTDWMEMYFSVDAGYLLNNFRRLFGHVATPDQLEILVRDREQVVVYLGQGGRKATLELGPPHVKGGVKGGFSCSGRKRVAGMMRLFLRAGEGRKPAPDAAVAVSWSEGVFKIGGVSMVMAETTGERQVRTGGDLAELMATGEPFPISGRDRAMLRAGINSYAEVVARQPEYLAKYEGKIYPGNTRLACMVLAYHRWACGLCGLKVRKGRRGYLTMEDLHVVVMPASLVKASLPVGAAGAPFDGDGGGNMEDWGRGGDPLGAREWVHDQFRVMCSRCYQTIGEEWERLGVTCGAAPLDPSTTP